jgi:GNAT superfamily N-acetyltransferase
MATGAREVLGFAPMTAETRPAAERLLGRFLDGDPHYQASAATYGDGGRRALTQALDLFLARPELGFVWIATRNADVVGACVVCHAISTSRGSLVAKLDDVTVDPDRQRQGNGAAMLAALAEYLRARGFGRIDTACHRDNDGAWRFYERLGYRPLHEERIACLL